MKKTGLPYNLVIYKANHLLIILSLTLGWIMLPLKKNNNSNLQNYLLGYTKLYKFFFKLKGFGYKWKWNLDLKKISGFFKLGYTHRISLIPGKNEKFRYKKKRFIIKCRSNIILRKKYNFLFFLYKKNRYNKKGIYLRGTNFKLKISKKKSKF